MKNHNKRMKELNSILKNLEDDEEMTNDSIKNIECLEKKFNKINNVLDKSLSYSIKEDENYENVDKE